MPFDVINNPETEAEKIGKEKFKNKEGKRR